MTSSEIERATFGLVAECLNQLRYRVPLLAVDVVIVILSPPKTSRLYVLTDSLQMICAEYAFS
jgi:hypothetical protein